jgi:hypothetical protein
METKMMEDYKIQFGKADIEKATDVLAIVLLKELVKDGELSKELVNKIELKYLSIGNPLTENNRSHKIDLLETGACVTG